DDAEDDEPDQPDEEEPVEDVEGGLEAHVVTGSHARRALLALARGVGADRRALGHRGRGDGHAVARGWGRETVHAAPGGTAALLADPVVLRAVARALEPLRRLAPRHATAEVRALLIQGDIALLHPRDERRKVRGDLLGLRDRALRVRLDIGARGRVVIG